MKLLTAEIIKKARAQYRRGSSMKQNVVAKFFSPSSNWTWYMMNLGEDLDYAWGIVQGFELEMGSFLISELQKIKGQFGLGIERDLYFKSRPAEEIWKELQEGKHV